MPQTINTNVVSLNAQRTLNSSQSSLATSMQRLSSGLRINSSKDDAAGLAIADRMTSQVRGMNVAVRNANDAISMAQTAEGALGKMGDSLQRMRELAVQARNASNSDSDRVNLEKEFKELQDEVDRTIKGSKFNGKDLFSSNADATMTYQVGAGTTSEDSITVTNVIMGGGTAATAAAAKTAYDTTATDADIQGVMATLTKQFDGTDGVSIGNKDVAELKGGTVTVDDALIKDTIDLLDTALDIVNDRRAAFGATQNRFESVVSNLQVNIENQSAAKGRIMDADFATETANLSRSQILQQAGNAMVAQANQLPQQVLSLLR